MQENSADKTKKVLIFSLDYLPGTISGAEEAIQEVTDRVDDIEWHMVTLYYDSNVPRVTKIGNVTIHYVGLFGKPNASLIERRRFPLHYNKHYFQLIAGIKGYLLHRKYEYDAVWGMMPHGTGVPSVIFKWLAPKVPYIITTQEGDPPEHIERSVGPLWFIWKHCFPKATIVQSISSFLADWAKRRGATCPVVIVRNGANPESINPKYSVDELAELKKQLGKKDGDVYLVNTARLVHQKGWDVTMKALLLLPSHVKLLVVGGGPDELMLKDLAKELKVDDRVIFTGQIDRAEVTKYRLVSDIFVGPSRSEGLGNAFVSAMAGGLPVIATQVGGIADFLFDANLNPDKLATGWAVDPDNPEQIVEKVNYILDHQEEVKKVTKQAQSMVLKEYDWDIIAKRMREEVFEYAFNQNL